MTQSGFFVGCCLAFALLGGCTTDSRLDSSPVTVSLLGDGRVTYAKGFQLTTQKNYLLLSIFSRNSILNDTIQFALIRRGEAAPQGFREDQIIPIPVRTMAVTASSHVGAIDRLEAWDALVGVGSGNQIFARRVKEKFQQGTLEEIHNGLKLDEEKVVALQPEVLIVTGGSETDQTSIESLRKSGVKVIENYEWMETTPLGRAEWIKLIAALLDRLNFAEHQFAQVEM
ncbi:MAG: ABC transporter substrate-binding protein, partial [Spirosomataceae bacterium]